jgi:hypothetical protein
MLLLEVNFDNSKLLLLRSRCRRCEDVETEEVDAE